MPPAAASAVNRTRAAVTDIVRRPSGPPRSPPARLCWSISPSPEGGIDRRFGQCTGILRQQQSHLDTHRLLAAIAVSPLRPSPYVPSGDLQVRFPVLT